MPRDGTKAAEIIRLLSEGKSNAAIARIVRCAKSYVRAVRSRESAPDHETRAKRYSASRFRTATQNRCRLAGIRARNSAIARGLDTKLANELARMAYADAKKEGAHA